MSAVRQHRPTHALHRHTPDCSWDVVDRRWRCRGDRSTGTRGDLPRLPRVDGPQRRRPPMPHPAAPTIRLGADPDVDDGC